MVFPGSRIWAVASLIVFSHGLPSRDLVVFQELGLIEAGGMHNVQIQYRQPVDGRLSIQYGDCQISAVADCHHSLGETHIGDHPIAKRHDAYEDLRPTRFVWLPPKDLPSGFCLHAFADDRLVGSSKPVAVARRKTRRQAKTFADVADPEGPWFDGVEYLQQKQPDELFVAQTKSKKIGIIGGGMSGLMTAYLLSSVGFKNWEILEASKRVGGRVHTSYLAGTRPEDYQYQEMGPMRFPVSITDKDTKETLEINDHKLVFQLADAMNKINGNSPALAVNFIPFIEDSPNAPIETSKRRSDGTVPGNAEADLDPSLRDDPTESFSNASEVAEAQARYNEWTGMGGETIALMAKDMFRAHKKALADGLFDYSQYMYLRYKLNYSANIADQASDGPSRADFGPSWLYEYAFFRATEWRTIDKGLSRLPKSMEPLVLGKTTFGAKIDEMTYDEKSGKVIAHWRDAHDLLSLKGKSKAFDYAVIAVPFTKVRLWRLPKYSSLLRRAISNVNWAHSCKVALHYKKRFWEHLKYPIFGGCGSTSIPGIGSICYPSYKINSTGPGVLLASYSFGDAARSLGSLPEKEHVAHVQRAMVEIHGKVAADQYTGHYDRICWSNDEFAAGAWAAPNVGQEPLYMPAYYRTEMRTVFVGEHTSFTHAWISSALESAIRGTVQLLLDMGLVDEAKTVTRTWMARWMSI